MSFKPFWPFLFLYVAQLLEMPFQDGVPFEYAFNSFRLNLMTYIGHKTKRIKDVRMKNDGR